MMNDGERYAIGSKDDPPATLAIIFNSAGHPIGAFSIEPGSGGDRILPGVGLLCELMGLSIYGAADSGFTVFPMRAADEVEKLLNTLAPEKKLTKLKMPGRG